METGRRGVNKAEEKRMQQQWPSTAHFSLSEPKAGQGWRDGKRKIPLYKRR